MVHHRHGLGIFGGEQPGLVDPVRLEIRVDAFQPGHEFFEQFSLAELEVGVFGFEVIAHVDDMLAAEVFGRDVIGMLDQRQAGEALALGQVEPVVALGGELVLEREDHHQGGHALKLEQTFQVAFGQGGSQVSQAGGRGGHQNALEDLAGGSRLDLDQNSAALGLGRDGADAGRIAQVHTHPAQPLGEQVGKMLEAALEGAQARGARLDAGPHPGHVDLLIVLLAELAEHERLPHQAVDLLPGPLAHPGIHSHFLELAPVGGQAQVQTDQPEAQLVQPPAQAGEQDGFQDRIERGPFALVEHDGEGAREEHLVAQTQLFDQPEHVLVPGEPVVVELLHRPVPARFLETGGQPGGMVFGLEDGDVVPGFGEVIGGSHAPEARSDDRYFHGYSVRLIILFVYDQVNGYI